MREELAGQPADSLVIIIISFSLPLAFANAQLRSDFFSVSNIALLPKFLALSQLSKIINQRQKLRRSITVSHFITVSNFIGKNHLTFISIKLESFLSFKKLIGNLLRLPYFPGMTGNMSFKQLG